MNIGCIIRTVGERTVGLCFDSVRESLPEQDIHIVRNAKPFSSALDQMLDIVDENNYDWYWGLDADVVLKDGWYDDVQKYTHLDAYRVDFPIIDRFVGKEIYGSHFYNGKYTDEVREHLEVTRNTNKPEGNIRHKMSNPEVLAKDTVGYHGFMQYHRDIFSRFALRYKRDKNFVRYHRIFKEMDSEKEVAQSGWEYAKKNDVDFMNSDNKSIYYSYYDKDIEPLEINLVEFYKIVKEIV